jgi:hypothetical protein
MTVFLFSGHLMDRPDRATPRFPPSMEEAAATAIAKALDRHGAGPADVGVSQAASGGDLLFLEACRARGVRRQILLPFDADTFEQTSVRPSLHGGQWRARYRRALAAPGASVRDMPTALGPLPVGHDPYSACNRWLLDTALAETDGDPASASLCFICLWNGAGPEGPGGTAHMVSAVRALGGLIEHIDTRALDR